jgi:hypothetical protein
MNKDLEEYFIREQLYRLEEVKKLQTEEGFYLYEPGNVLLVNIDNSKTIKRFAKKRRAFSRLRVFINYEHGNVVCEILINAEEEFKKLFTIPIFYTKFISTSVDNIPLEYRVLIS